MKDWKEIANLRPDELEKAAAGVPVPDDLETVLTALVEELDKGERALEVRLGGKGTRPARRAWGWLAVAAAVIAVTVVGLSLQTPAPKDTYDDPALAYAEVERAFGLVAAKMQYGSEKFSASQDVMEQRIRSVFDEQK